MGEESAKSLGEALEGNCSLKDLNVSYNSALLISKDIQSKAEEHPTLVVFSALHTRTPPDDLAELEKKMVKKEVRAKMRK